MLLGIAFVALIIYQYWHFRTHFPHGPWPLPFVGNSFELRGAKRWEDKFLEWKNKYGNIYTFVSGKNQLWVNAKISFEGVIPIITVNDYETIVELFVKDGDTYADRFGIKAFNDLVRGGDYGIIGTSGKSF